MRLIFWGLLLVFLDFSLTLKEFSIDLLPDVAGYLLLFIGAGRMQDESRCFSRMRPVAIVLALFDFVMFVFGPIYAGTWIQLLPSLLINLITTILYLYMLWQLVRGIQDIETRSLYPLGAQELRTTFFVILGLTIISLFAANILALLSPLFLLLLIVAIFVVLVLFLVLVLRAAVLAIPTVPTITLPAARIKPLCGTFPLPCRLN